MIKAEALMEVTEGGEAVKAIWSGRIARRAGSERWRGGSERSIISRGCLVTFQTKLLICGAEEEEGRSEKDRQ